jgi:hypothetical protein
MALIGSDPTPPSAADLQAKRIIQVVNLLYDQAASEWKRAMHLLWNPRGETTTEEILVSLGTDAQRVFELSGAIVQLLEYADPGSTAETTALRKDFTFNGDGTVSLNTP